MAGRNTILPMGDDPDILDTLCFRWLFIQKKMRSSIHD